MIRNYLHYFIRTTFVISLLVTSISPIFAQSAPEVDGGVTASTVAAATEIMDTTVATLDSPMMNTESTAGKENNQTTEKAIPGDSDVSPEDVAQEVVEKRSLFLPIVATANTLVEAASIAPPARWNWLEYELFEGSWPDAGWRTYDCNGSTGGDRYWDDESYKPKTGSWSAWPAGAGANYLNPYTSFYGNNACAWMIYGPFSLQYASAAKLTFNYWNQSERNYDWFEWMASCNGVNFYGTKTSGDSAGWRSQQLDLAKIPGLGSCLRDSTVWIGFRFSSDGSNVDDGPFVDDVQVQAYQ